MGRKWVRWRSKRMQASDGSAQAQWRATVAARLPSQRWSAQQLMLIVAIDAHSTVNRSSSTATAGVELADAVAARAAANGFGVPPLHYRRAPLHRRRLPSQRRTPDLAAPGYARVLVLSPLGEQIAAPGWTGAPISQRRPKNYAHAPAVSKPSSRIATLKTHSRCRRQYDGSVDASARR